MVEKEIAKFEKPLIRRNNSWEYPKAPSNRSSSVAASPAGIDAAGGFPAGSCGLVSADLGNGSVKSCLLYPLPE
jgi:hypothetical protein